MDTATAIQAYRATRPKRYATCGTTGCTNRVSGIAWRCEKCRTRKRRFGTPEGKAIPRREIGPPRNAARAYLNGPAADHPRIAAALSWANRWLLSGQPQGDHWQGMGSEQAVSAFLHRLERGGIAAADVLATFIALAYVRRYRPGIVKGDRHWQFSVVRAVLNLLPWPQIGHSARAGGSATAIVFMPRPRVIDAAWQQIPPEVLVLADDVAAVIREHEERLALAPAINDPTPLPAATTTPTT